MIKNEHRSWPWLIAVVPAVLLLSGCGGDDDDSASEQPVPVESDGADGGDTERGGSAGAIDSAPPPGQATVSVDGIDITFELPGALECSISAEALTYSYRVGDNEVTLGAGLNFVGDGWMGNIALTVANPDDEPGPIGYYPAPGDLGVLDQSLFTIDGASAMYRGPMLKQPANDGSQPPPVDVGIGTVIATC
jgi:hypothetical protein